MEHLRKFGSGIRARLFWLLIIDNVIFAADWWASDKYFKLTGWQLIIPLAAVPIILVAVLPWLVARWLAKPTELISQAIMHVAPGDNQPAASPDPTNTKLGQELVATLMHNLYEFATAAEARGVKTPGLGTDFVASSLPLPLLLLNENKDIVFANEAAASYLGASKADLIGKNFYSLLDMAFPTADTLDIWLTDMKNRSATASRSWERVRLAPSDLHPLRLFDLAAYYNKDNSRHLETMLVLFDHTKSYSQDDQAVSFMALSVHELRTPLTLLRGYIEAFEDEFAGKLDPQMNDFMFKMSASAQQLTAFVNNILNVARIDDDQLVLHLHEEDWPGVIRAAANNLALRAKVRGITLEYSIAPDLPTVGVDRVSILEVINNLVDNAIKYSGQSHRIRISTRLTNEGLVETDIQDWGVGIPDNILPKLFTKFYRDHHNRAQIGGTGLGLYLSKAIVSAHGGNIWVKSKLGEGSTFSFTLVPFGQLSDAQKAGDSGITRGAHGWIKNHSLYRR